MSESPDGHDDTHEGCDAVMQKRHMAESEQEPRVALLTGATSGIGFSTAVELAHRRVRLLLHGRTAASAEAAVARVRAEVPLARVQAVWADLCVRSEVRTLRPLSRHGDDVFRIREYRRPG